MTKNIIWYISCETILLICPYCNQRINTYNIPWYDTVFIIWPAKLSSAMNTVQHSEVVSEYGLTPQCWDTRRDPGQCPFLFHHPGSWHELVHLNHNTMITHEPLDIYGVPCVPLIQHNKGWTTRYCGGDWYTYNTTQYNKGWTSRYCGGDWYTYNTIQ